MNKALLSFVFWLDNVEVNLVMVSEVHISLSRLEIKALASRSVQHKSLS